jgi:hypothetical protein
MVLNWVQDDELGCSCQAGPGSARDLVPLNWYLDLASLISNLIKKSLPLPFSKTLAFSLLSHDFL